MSSPGAGRTNGRGGLPARISTGLPHAMVLDFSRPRGSLLLAAVDRSSVESHALFELAVPGGSPRRLGTLAAWAAAWSHDGRLIAMTHREQAGSRLSVARADGNEEKTLWQGRGLAHGVAWTPDDGKLRLGTRDPQAGESWTDEVDVRSGSSRRMRGAPGTWTPDGRYYVFGDSAPGKGTRLGGRPRADLFAVRERASTLWRSSDPVQLTFGPMDMVDPVFAAEGRQILAAGFTELRGELVSYARGGWRLASA